MRASLLTTLDWPRRRSVLRAAAWPIAQTALGAGAAWALARYGLGHKQPFFAPIAATISLGWRVGQRARQAVQLMTGVAVGIVVADLLVAAVGTGALQIALVVALAMFAALLLSRSPLLVNQAGASAILVMALHRPHGGSQRLLDALAGGAVAILIGAVLFPADPRKLVADAARGVLDALADGLERVSDALAHPEQVVSGWSLEIARRVHASLATLANAQDTAATVVKVAPQRRRAREDVERFIAQAAQLDLLANAELSLARRSGRFLMNEGKPPPWLAETLRSLVKALKALAEDPASGAAQEKARSYAVDAAAETRQHTESNPEVVALAEQARAMARDVLYVTGLEQQQAKEVLAGT